MLVEWELPEDSQFPSVAPNQPEAVKYTSLWVTKDPQWVNDRKIFWTLMEMNVHMAINHKPRLSLTNFEKFQEYTEFKVDLHHVPIRAWKDPEHNWHDLPYLAIDDAIQVVLDSWMTKWHTASNLTTGSSKTVDVGLRGADLGSTLVSQTNPYTNGPFDISLWSAV